MNLSNIKIRTDYSVISKEYKFAIVNKDSFLNAIDFIKSSIEEVAFENLTNKYQIIIPDAKIINGETIVNDHILINQQNFNYFVIAVKILMEDNYQLLKDKYQFNIFPLDINYNDFFLTSINTGT